MKGQKLRRSKRNSRRRIRGTRRRRNTLRQICARSWHRQRGIGMLGGSMRSSWTLTSNWQRPTRPGPRRPLMFSGGCHNWPALPCPRPNPLPLSHQAAWLHPQSTPHTQDNKPTGTIYQTPVNATPLPTTTHPPSTNPTTTPLHNMHTSIWGMQSEIHPAPPPPPPT